MEKEKLLQLLEEKEIIEKIKEIVSSEYPQKSKEQPTFSFFNKEDDNKKKEKKKEKEKLEKQIDALEKENLNLTKQLKEIQTQRNYYYSQLEEKQNQLQSIVTETKEHKKILMKTLENTKMENSKLEQRINKLTTELQSIKNENVMLRNENAMEKETIAKSHKELLMAQDKAIYYQRKYKNIDKYFEAYVSLGNGVHQDLERVLSAESPEIFFCYGTQWSNIEALWDFISYKLTKYPPHDIEVLNSIFDYFFQCYQNISGNYKRLQVNVGEEFDDDIHTRASNSEARGTISEVLLVGYEGTRNGKIKKSIVRI